MANNRLTYFRSLINRQISIHETLSEYLTQAETLTNVAASCREFAELGEEIINNYAWAVCEILYKANKLNGKVLNELIGIRTKRIRKNLYRYQSNQNTMATDNRTEEKRYER